MILPRTEEYLRTVIKQMAIENVDKTITAFSDILYLRLRDIERRLGGLAPQCLFIPDKDEVGFFHLYAYGIAFHVRYRLIKNILHNGGDENAET